MAIRFKTIRWKNFLSTGNQWTELDLDSQGTTLIVGENGAGKSTLLDALTFALFGKPFRNINKPQLTNTITKKSCSVELEFFVSSNHYKIIRGLKPNVFEVYCNDSLLNQSADNRDYQEILEQNIIKTNYKTFCQVGILGSAAYVPFMQLPAAQRRSVIEDLLELQVFTVMNVLLKERIQTNNEDIRQNVSEQKLISAKINLVKQHLNELLTKTESFVQEKTVAIDNITSKIVDAKRQITDNENLANQLNSPYAELSLRQKLKKLEGLRTQLETKLSTLRNEINFFVKHQNCPTCTQEISEQFRCEAVESKNTNVNEIVQGIEKLDELLDETNKKLNETVELNNKIAKTLEPNSILKVQIRHWTEQIEGLKKEISNVNTDITENSETKIFDLELDQSEILKSYTKLQDDRLVLSAAASLLKDGGIKTKIINQYVPIINKLLNKYLSDFDLFVEFNLDEQFNENIKSRYRDDFSYPSFSEGEKQKIDLAILFTWRAVAKLRNSLNTNLLIMDEVFDSSLDGNSADDLLKILKILSKETNVFVISHRESLQDKFDNTIKFVKQKNFSRIEENESSQL